MTFVVGVDPGHGLANRAFGVFDPGAVYDDVREADITLAVGLMLREECLRRNWKAPMTRQSNDDPANLRWRVARMRTSGADCLVSIHCNAAEKVGAHGTETLHAGHEWVAAAVQRRLVAALGTRDRGIKIRSNLAILKYERAAILVELAFLSHDGDRAILTDPERQRAAAGAIADGIEEAVRR